ncbi:MAG: hypothetical protein MRY83_22255 [Flavobacteriales bacterium]|nr:hypothetical protein [Flavobacteriales bacterium]
MKYCLNIITIIALNTFLINAQVIKIKKNLKHNIQHNYLPYSTLEDTHEDVFPEIDNHFYIISDTVNQHNLVAYAEKPHNKIPIKYEMVSMDYIVMKKMTLSPFGYFFKKSRNTLAGHYIPGANSTAITDYKEGSTSTIPLKRFYICIENERPGTPIYIDVYERFDHDSLYLGKIKLVCSSIRKPTINVNPDWRYKEASVLGLNFMLDADKKNTNSKNKQLKRKMYNPFYRKKRLYKSEFLAQLSKDEGASIFQNSKAQHLKNSKLAGLYNVTQFKISISDRKRKFRYRETIVGNRLTPSAISAIKSTNKKVKVFIYAIKSSHGRTFKSESFVLK